MLKISANTIYASCENYTDQACYRIFFDRSSYTKHFFKTEFIKDIWSGKARDEIFLNRIGLAERIYHR